MWIFVIVVSLMTGYQAGKAGAKAEGRDNQGYCMVEMDSSTGCYSVSKTTNPKEIKRLQKAD